MNSGLIGKYAAVAARMRGVDGEFLSTDVSPPLVALARITSSSGFAPPLVGRSMAAELRAGRRHRLLAPLRAELHAPGGPASGLIRWWNPPVVRLARQEIAIWDGVPACSPYPDERVRGSAYAKALASTGDGTDPEAARRPAVVAEAARPATARTRAAHGRRAELPQQVRTLTAVSEPRPTVELARALSSPVVAEARRRAALHGSTGSG